MKNSNKLFHHSTIIVMGLLLLGSFFYPTLLNLFFIVLGLSLFNKAISEYKLGKKLNFILISVCSIVIIGLYTYKLF